MQKENTKSPSEEQLDTIIKLYGNAHISRCILSHLTDRHHFHGDTGDPVDHEDTHIMIDLSKAFIARTTIVDPEYEYEE